MKHIVETTCCEPETESSERRTCHRCGYLLIGHSEPARCPECGSLELSQGVVRSGHQAGRWWRVAFVGPFISRAAGESLWLMALHPSFARLSRNRSILIVAAFVGAMLTAALLCHWWVYKSPVEPGDGTYTQRCWWYETHGRRLPATVLHGRTPSGEAIAYKYNLGVSWRHVPLRVVELAAGGVGGVFHLVIRRFGIPWAFLGIGWPLLCAIVLGVETKRGFRLAGVLSASFVPFLLFVPVMFLAKLAYTFFWIDWQVIQFLCYLHLPLAFWPGLTYARYAKLSGSSRWRRYTCAGVTGLVVLWPVVACAGYFQIEELVLNWI